MSDDPLRVHSSRPRSTERSTDSPASSTTEPSLPIDENFDRDRVEICGPPSQMQIALAASLFTTTPGVTIARAEPLPEIPDALRPAFEVLVRAGVDPRTSLDLVFRGATPAEAKQQLQALLNADTSLAAFGPKAVAISVLARLAAGSEVSGRDVRALIDAHKGLRVARPDGYVVRALSGTPIERAGEVLMDGDRLRAGPLEVGRFYACDEGVLYPMTGSLQREVGANPVFEHSLDRMLPGRVLDGAEDAMKTTILSVGRFIENPARTTAEAIDAFGNLGRLLTSTPELCDRFLNMPLGDQVEAISKLAMTLALAKGLTGAGAMGVSAGGNALGNASMLAIKVLRGEVAAGGLLQLDLAAAVTGVAGGGAWLLAPISAAPLLAESSLPELSEKAAAALKRASKELPKEIAAPKKKALQQLAAQQEKLMEKLDALLADDRLTERSKAMIERAKNALEHHLKPDDLSGALRDAVDLRITKAGGGVWQHDKEVADGLEALQKARASLSYEFQRGAWDGKVATELSALADQLLDFTSGVEAFLDVEG